jgi:hypothetical protein
MNVLREQIASWGKIQSKEPPKVNAQYGGTKNVVTLYYFPKVFMFELQPW